jgi:hypothetical protein
MYYYYFNYYGDIDVPGFDLKCGLPLENCKFYSKLRGDAVQTSLVSSVYCSVLMLTAAVICLTYHVVGK